MVTYDLYSCKKFNDNDGFEEEKNMYHSYIKIFYQLYSSNN